MIRKWLDRKLAAIGGAMAAGEPDPAATSKSRAERFQDPLAGRVAWTGKSRSTSGMRTHKLVARGRDRMKFRATAQILALGLGLTVPPIYVSLCLLPAHGLAVWFWVLLDVLLPVVLDRRPRPPLEPSVDGVLQAVGAVLAGSDHRHRASAWRRSRDYAELRPRSARG